MRDLKFTLFFLYEPTLFIGAALQSVQQTEDFSPLKCLICQQVVRVKLLDKIAGVAFEESKPRHLGMTPLGIFLTV